MKLLATRICYALMLGAGVMPGADLAIAIRITIDVAASNPSFSSAITRDLDGDGHLDHLVVTFNTPMDVRDHNGAADGLPGLVLSDGYQILSGDYAATAIVSISLPIRAAHDRPDTGVRPLPTYDAGSGAFVTTGDTGREMSDGATVATTDGAPPVLDLIRPVSGQEIDQADVSWSTTEDLAEGTVTYTRTGGSVDPTVHRTVLSTAELAAGLHDALPLDNAPNLVDGAAYTVTLAGSDPAGNPGVPESVQSVRFVRVKGTGMRRPAIVSDPPLESSTGERWTYDVEVDVSALHAVLAADEFYDLRFALAAAPAGAVIVKTGPTTARITWVASATEGAHRLVVIRVYDAQSKSSDRQEVLVHVVAPTSGDG
jgi:hypothetical protein